MTKTCYQIQIPAGDVIAWINADNQDAAIDHVLHAHRGAAWATRENVKTTVVGRGARWYADNI